MFLSTDAKNISKQCFDRKIVEKGLFDRCESECWMSGDGAVHKNFVFTIIKLYATQDIRWPQFRSHSIHSTSFVFLLLLLIA